MQPDLGHLDEPKVKSLTFGRHDLRDDLGAVNRFLAAALRRIDAGEGDLVELHRLAAIASQAAAVRDRLTRLLLQRDVSQREIAAATGVSKTAIAHRFSGESSRRRGAQPSHLR